MNLASALSLGSEEYGISSRRVLLVDMDPKGNVATTFGVDKRTVGPTMNELFSRGVDSSSLKLEDCTLGPDFLTRSMKASWRKSNPGKSRGPPNHIAVRNLWVLPADLDLSGIEVDLATRVGRENRLKLALSEAMDSFDVIIIDTPASLGLLTVNGCRVGPNSNPSRVLCPRRNGTVDICSQRCAEVSKPKSRIARHSDDDGTDKEQTMRNGH